MMNTGDFSVDCRTPEVTEFFFPKGAVILPPSALMTEILSEWTGTDRQILLSADSDERADSLLQNAGFLNVSRNKKAHDKTDVLIFVSDEEAALDMKFSEPHFIYVNTGSDNEYAGFGLEYSCNIFNIHDRMEEWKTETEYIVISEQTDLAVAIASLLKTRGFNLVKVADARPEDVLNFRSS